MLRSKGNVSFEQLLEDSLQKLVKSLEKEIASGVSSVFFPDGKEKKSSGTIWGGGNPTVGALNVIIHNNASVSVGAQEKTDAYGQKQLEITIDQMVANALVRGRQTSGVLGGLFNVTPGLSGR